MNLPGKPLFLEPGVAWLVTLDDGVALRVEAPGRARSLYPLPRLSRVQSGVQARWSTEALLACLRAGVTVVFVDARGSVHGWCFGPRRREMTLSQRLREALREPQWPQFWQAWQQQVGVREVQRLLRRMSLHAVTAADPKHLHIKAMNHMTALWGTGPGPWVRALQRAQRALSAQVCSDILGDPQLLCYAYPGLNLPEALADLMQLRLDGLLLSWPVKDILSQPPGQVAARIVEERNAELYRGCAELLGDLEFVLREWQP
ncbi:hypothetical protein [Caldimonas sp.]|uniref:hypothetical protein n=1 Tax=Caldimonas sp. TaxID=2838790 RepID=UPI0021DCD012|nr:MAG: hypothetical protein KatS3mg122_1486 [Caldimonas sp.]